MTASTPVAEAPPGPNGHAPAQDGNRPVDPAAILQGLSNSMARRGYLTTEWWTTVVAAGLSTVLALVGLKGPAAAQVVGILAPVLLSIVYSGVRTMHKSALAQAATAAFPQARQTATAPSPSAGIVAAGDTARA